MLKAVVDKLDDVAEPFRKEYTARADGKFVLAIEGVPDGFVAKADHDANTVKLTEFRDNNRALNTQVTELTTKLKSFEGVDPAEYKTLKQKAAAIGAQDGDLEGRLKLAVEAATKPLIDKVTALETADKKKTADLATATFRDGLKDAAIKAGVEEKMMPVFIDYALKTFVFDEATGKFTPKKGDAPIYSPTKPAEVITPVEWAALQATEVPGFFKGSGGGGAGEGDGQRTIAGKKVISSDPFVFGQNLESIAKGDTVVQSR